MTSPAGHVLAGLVFFIENRIFMGAMTPYLKKMRYLWRLNQIIIIYSCQ